MLSTLVALGHTNKMLIQEFNCVEDVQDPPADATAGDVADEHDGNGLRPAAPLPLPPLILRHASEDEDASQLPQQRHVTAQVMRHRVQHKAIKDRPPSTRCAQMLALHQTQVIDAIFCTEEGDMGHSILQGDMPDDEHFHHASRPRGGNFATRHPRGSCTSTSLAHDRWRNANLHGRRGSAST